MTEGEINSAIAEACGWKDFIHQPFTDKFHLHWTETSGTNPKGILEKVPDYCHDLNAMHEAETTIPDKQWSDALMRVIQDQANCPAVEARYKTAKASAFQRAKAFLLTRGKWKD